MERDLKDFPDHSVRAFSTGSGGGACPSNVAEQGSDGGIALGVLPQAPYKPSSSAPALLIIRPRHAPYFSLAHTTNLKHQTLLAIFHTKPRVASRSSCFHQKCQTMLDAPSFQL
ncbi:hypothetical protein PGT21_002118 [Puccinia graminis f. sp. tritici]|uniref:Uncharacterized protein n=1 Tax=Puccinia graminis f. sp. tritici TaxID=56615 RepID=A0A5B0NZA6_PUCGR|nr:hypothetical protein PGT21_002118 [Puccinia graminis f. sp. tritici]